MDSSVLRARAMVLTGERTLSDTSGARQFCPRARQTAADNYVYRLSGVLKNILERAHQGTNSHAKLCHSPGMPAAEKHKLVYETPNYVTHTRFDSWCWVIELTFENCTLVPLHQSKLSWLQCVRVSRQNSPALWCLALPIFLRKNCLRATSL
jgi:hypothetical protein